MQARSADGERGDSMTNPTLEAITKWDGDPVTNPVGFAIPVGWGGFYFLRERKRRLKEAHDKALKDALQPEVEKTDKGFRVNFGEWMFDVQFEPPETGHEAMHVIAWRGPLKLSASWFA